MALEREQPIVSIPPVDHQANSAFRIGFPLLFKQRTLQNLKSHTQQDTKSPRSMIHVLLSHKPHPPISNFSLFPTAEHVSRRRLLASSGPWTGQPWNISRHQIPFIQSSSYETLGSGPQAVEPTKHRRAGGRTRRATQTMKTLEGSTLYSLVQFDAMAASFHPWKLCLRQVHASNMSPKVRSSDG